MSRTTFEEYDDIANNCKVYKITLAASDYSRIKLTGMDYALLDDIDHGKPSDTPIADKLLGLEMIVRHIEEATQPTNVTKGEVDR